MKLAPTTSIGTVAWEGVDLDHEALILQHLLTGYLLSRPCDDLVTSRPGIRLQLDGATYAVTAGCLSVNHHGTTLVIGIYTEPPEQPNYHLGFRKAGSAPWRLLDYCVLSFEEDDGAGMQELEDHALAMLMGLYA